MLADQETTLKAKSEAADKLIKIVSAENEIVQKEKLIGMAKLANKKQSLLLSGCNSNILHTAHTCLYSITNYLNTYSGRRRAKSTCH